ncbi:MAG: helix-turn-helix transcriptional regulator [Lachnospiraceae bacterium]|nr:helix-turn-helix transcriptional regulator [Lachnospiraceae bacterium]
MENGEAAVLSGMSGIELARAIITTSTGREIDITPEENFARSPDYWIGWAVAFYQWWSGRSFGSIFKALGYRDLHRMYYTLHEADISKFIEIADAKVKEYYPETNLKYIRSAFGCSQAELSEMSGVGLRSIQMYEQRNKDINKASAGTVRSLAKALGCKMEDLLEN